MAARPIPPRPSLEFDRKQAKSLLDAVRAGDPSALARFRASHPRFHSAAAPDGRGLEHAALHDAQLVIAREYGFASWPRWKQFVDGRALDSGGRAAALIRAAVTADVRAARALLDAEPALAEHDLYTACVTGAAARVARLLAAEPRSRRPARRPARPRAPSLRVLLARPPGRSCRKTATAGLSTPSTARPGSPTIPS
jgi:hypothetical protein